jgi:WD40 repeat protein
MLHAHSDSPRGVNNGLRGSWRLSAGMAFLGIVLLAGCAARRPVLQLDVQGCVRSLTTSGTALCGDFVGDKTCIWDWGDLGKPPRMRPHATIGTALLGPRYVITELPASTANPQPAVVARQQPDDRMVRLWPLIADWYCSDLCNSPNGRYVGILLEEAKPSGGDTCLGSIGPGTQEIAWVTARGRVVKLAEDGMAIANNGRCMALLGLGDIRTLTLADLPRKKLLWQRSVPRARSLAFSPDGSIVYEGGYYGIHALQAVNGQLLDTWSMEASRDLSAPVARIAASPDGRYLAVGTDLPDGKAYLLDARTGKQVTSWAVADKADIRGRSWSLRPAQTAIDGLAFSPGAKLLATADSLSQSVRIWQMPDSAAPKGGFGWLRRK